MVNMADDGEARSLLLRNSTVSCFSMYPRVYVCTLALGDLHRSVWLCSITCPQKESRLVCCAFRCWLQAQGQHSQTIVIHSSFYSKEQAPCDCRWGSVGSRYQEETPLQHACPPVVVCIALTVGWLIFMNDACALQRQIQTSLPPANFTDKEMLRERVKHCWACCAGPNCNWQGRPHQGFQGIWFACDRVPLQRPAWRDRYRKRSERCAGN